MRALILTAMTALVLALGLAPQTSSAAVILKAASRIVIVTPTVVAPVVVVPTAVVVRPAPVIYTTPGRIVFHR